MKPEFMRLRRALAGTVAALLLAAGLVVLSPALSASAHHNTISVAASCVNYQWTITWKVTNSERDKTEKITYSSDESIIAKDVVIDKGATYTKVERVSGPVTKSLSISAVWQNGVTNSDKATITDKDFHGDCKPKDDPKLNAAADGCVAYGTNDGKVTFSLNGASTTYTVELRQNGTMVTSTTSPGGSSAFASVAPGTYTVKASTSKKSVETKPFAVAECAPNKPVVELVVDPCVTGGALGAVTAKMSNLNSGATYALTLHSDNGAALETKTEKASGADLTVAFAKRGPGTYYVTVAIGSGPVLATSASATITKCPPVVVPKLTVELEPCVALQTGTEREINVTVDGLTASTAYTVRLVTTASPAVEIAKTTTPANAVSFSHTFTGVPSPADYKVEVVGGTQPLVSDTVTAAKCGLDTLAPPSIELLVDQCDGVDKAAGALSARMIDLDATKTYYVRLVDGSGDTVAGGEDQTVTGSTTATVQFPGVTAPGTYTAQLLIDPGKQLAATSPSSVDLAVCLPTLAMTGPGVLVPLGSVAALLLTLGGAVVMGRLRRRMAL